MKFNPTNSTNAHLQCRAHITTNGRLSIPASFRKAANIKDGDEVILFLKDNGIQVQPLDQVVAEAQALVAEYFAGEDLSADLGTMRAADREREARRVREGE